MFADSLIADVAELNRLVLAADFSISLDAISNGAIALLDEVTVSKITGEEDWWSGTDLSDFAANIQGAGVAYGSVKTLAEAKGEEGVALVAAIDEQFERLTSILAEYGSIPNGFANYDELTDTDTRTLSDQVNALAEPLSQLTHVVLSPNAGTTS